MTAAAAPIDADPDVVPFDDTCPHCRRSAELGEVFDGSWRRCPHCGKWVVAIAWTDETMSLISGEPESPMTGRQRTRALWRKRGRR